MTKHDENRLNSLMNTLEAAKNKAETASLYLTVNENNQELLLDVHLATEHIENAIERLKSHIPSQTQPDKEILPARLRETVIND